MLSRFAIAILIGVGMLVPAASGQDFTDLADRLGRLPKTLLAKTKSDADLIDTMFLATVVRLPKADEKARVTKLFEETKDRRKMAEDLLWALANTKEFAQLHGLSSLSPEQAAAFTERMTKAMREK